MPSYQMDLSREWKIVPPDVAVREHVAHFEARGPNGMSVKVGSSLFAIYPDKGVVLLRVSAVHQDREIVQALSRPILWAKG